MQLPQQLLESLKNAKGFNKEAFEKVHASREQVTSVRINHDKEFKIQNSTFKISPVPWSQYGYYLSERPSFTFDPLFHAGCYYVQEASSMFLEQALKQKVDLAKPLKILDLSAAPGGKSTHIQSLITKESLLVSNDVIRSRANILKDNIIKWGCENVMVTNNDPKDFVKLENYFDVIVVDAPCSGSGLFRREPEAINEWSLSNVALCSQRQRRILADVWPALKKDGILIYSTCSYSKEEDEEIMDWMMRELGACLTGSQVMSLELEIEEGWGIVKSQSGSGGVGYRFWPDKVKGEGFFIACFRKMDGEESASFKVRSKAEAVTKKEIEIAGKWIGKTNHSLVKYENTVYAWPENLAHDMHYILSHLRVIYSGVRIGELMRDKLVPGHALAMSRLVADSVGQVTVSYEQAIQYLQRRDMQAETKDKGWQLVTYEGYFLGWVNVLPNRINNYYPKELRILKESI